MTAPRHRPRPTPQRVAWHDGALLRADDLARAVAHEERLLALHVAALHDTWGVALGLELALSDDRREVVVTPGVAYTCAGDALLLAGATQAPPFPPGAARADLVISAPARAEGSECERVVACDGAPVRRERPALRWEIVALAADPSSAFAAGLAPGVSLGVDVPLGSVARRADGTLDTDGTQRRVARGLSRPHVGMGVIPSGALAWHGGADGAVATVDTSAAGFSAAPRYAAFLALPGAWPAGVVGPFVSVAQPARASFVARLGFGAGPGSGMGASWGLMIEAGVMSSLVWIGVESARGCPPGGALPPQLAPGLWTSAGTLFANLATGGGA